MMRFLSGYTVPIMGGLFVAVLALAGALYWSINSHAETRAERDALQSRLNNIETARGIDRDVQDLDSDAIGSELDERLSGDN